MLIGHTEPAGTSRLDSQMKSIDLFDNHAHPVRTTCVTIRDPTGRPFVHMTMARTLFEAVANAIEWFRDPYWHGPKPRDIFW